MSHATRSATFPTFPLGGGRRLLVGGGLASSANSFFDAVNREKPQSKHTKTFGNARMPGLSIFRMPLKWIIISAANSAKLLD
jgi:hypothetical protein